MQKYGQVNSSDAQAERDAAVVKRGGQDYGFSSGLHLSAAVAALLHESQTTRSAPTKLSLARDHFQSSNPPPPQHLMATGPAASERPSEHTSKSSPTSTPQIVHLKAHGPDGIGMTSLILRGCRASDTGMRALFMSTARCSRSLTTLDVSGCRGISLAFLAALPYGCPLAVLRADGCASIRQIDVSLPDHSALRQLSLVRCPNLTSIVLRAPCLQECNVSQSMQLHRITLVTPRLQHMRAVHCRNLAVLQLGETPLLTELNLMGVSKLPGRAISIAVEASMNLKTCNLTGCLSLASFIVPGVLASHLWPLAPVLLAHGQVADGNVIMLCGPCIGRKFKLVPRFSSVVMLHDQHVPAVNQNLEHLEVSASNLHTLTVRTAALRTLLARNCANLEAIRLAVPPLLCDVHNCPLLKSLHVEQPHTGEAMHLAEVELGGCDTLQGIALSTLHTWATNVRSTR